MTKKKKAFFTPLRVVLSAVLLLIIAVLGTWLLLNGKDVAVLNPQGIIAAQQKDLIVFTVLLSLIVVVPVFAMLGVFAWRYREGNTTAKYTPDVEGNKRIELIWWGVPIIIIGVLSVITWVTTHQLDPYKPIASSEKAIKVQVVALQWKWLFIYPELNVATVNELRMPVGTPVNFDITADAPMSSFWIPSLGTQTYAMNGMTSKLSLRADKAGEYRGTNTNINGEGYAHMNFTAVAMPKSAFNDWIETAEIDSDKDGRHMDWQQYEKLAMASSDTPVNYYHLHDLDLYDRVVKKYMNHGGDHDESANKSAHDAEGHSH